MNIPHYILRES